MTASKTDSLRATRVYLQNVVGLEEFDLALGPDVTWVKGPNGSGKSSLVEGILRTIGTGANLAEVARIDPETGEREPARTIILLEGQLDGRHRRFCLERKDGKQSLKEEVAGAWKNVPRPGEVVSALVDGVLANPVRFLQARPEERVKMLLSALPVELDRERVAAILALAGVPDGSSEYPLQVHALTELEIVRNSIYTARTAANRDAAAKTAAADQCRTAAGAPAADDPGKDADEAERIAREMRGEIEAYASTSAGVEEAAIQAAKAEARRQNERADADLHSRTSKVRADAEAQIAEKRRELEVFIKETNAAAGRAIDEIRAEVSDVRAAAVAQADLCIDEAAAARKERDQVLAEKRADLEMATAEAARLRQLSDQAQAAKGARDMAAKFQEEAEALRDASGRMTAALAQLDEYRRSLCSDLPAGLELRDGQLFVEQAVAGGPVLALIPFDQANTATRIRVAVEVACLRSSASPWRFVVVDGAEAFDTEHRQALAAELKRRGVQAILAAVDDGAFRGEQE